MPGSSRSASRAARSAPEISPSGLALPAHLRSARRPPRICANARPCTPIADEAALALAQGEVVAVHPQARDLTAPWDLVRERSHVSPCRLECGSLHVSQMKSWITVDVRKTTVFQVHEPVRAGCLKIRRSPEPALAVEQSGSGYARCRRWRRASARVRTHAAPLRPTRGCSRWRAPPAGPDIVCGS